MKTYCFYTTDGYRQDVKASTAQGAWNKINANKINAMPNFRERFTGAYGVYDKDGLMATGAIHGTITK